VSPLTHNSALLASLLTGVNSSGVCFTVTFHDLSAFLLSFKLNRYFTCFVFTSFLHLIICTIVHVQEVSEVLEQQRHLMKCVLEDTRLNRLRLEGGTVLARIRKEEACENENYRY